VRPQLSYRDVAEIVKIIDSSNCDEVSLDIEGAKILVRRKGAAAPPEAGGQISAQMVGTFYSRPSPDEPEFVSVGTQVEIGTPVCIIEVMKLFTTIESNKAGTVKAILAEDGQLVDYGQALFVID